MARVMAAAVSHLFDDDRLDIDPARGRILFGFNLPHRLGPEDFALIEAGMTRSVKIEADGKRVIAFPEADQSVCPRSDYGRFERQQGKRERIPCKSRATRRVKGIKFGAKVDEHDCQTTLCDVRDFIATKRRVRFLLVFGGRENSRREPRVEIMSWIARNSSDVAAPDQVFIKMDRAIVMTHGPCCGVNPAPTMTPAAPEPAGLA